MPLHPRILRIFDNLLFCRLSGIQIDFQGHFTAGRQGKNEEFAHLAGSGFGLEIGRVSQYCEARWFVHAFAQRVRHR
jgi:hypothetical protein